MAQDQDRVFVHVRQLSSGTVGKLCGKNDYESIDAYRIEFMNFVEKRPGEFNTWQEAWSAWTGNPI